MSYSEILNIKEVSAYLKIPVSTIYKLVQDGKVPAVKVGKHWRFMKRDLDLLFNQNRGKIPGSLLVLEEDTNEHESRIYQPLFRSDGIGFENNGFSGGDSGKAIY